MENKKKVLTFFGNKSPLSRYHFSLFEIEGVEFNSIGMYMAYMKARLFKDNETMIKILQTKNRSEYSKLSQNVVDFDREIWSKMSEKYLYDGYIAKVR